MTVNYNGLTTKQVAESAAKYGTNEIKATKKPSIFYKIWKAISEPMFALLIVASIIYFILGEALDGAIMFVFVIFILSIEAFQKSKTDKALNALKDLSAPHIDVIRDGKKINIVSANLVIGDLMLIKEGLKIPADAVILKCSDLKIDESSLTGESMEVEKVPTDLAEETTDYWRKDYCYQGTLVSQGSAYTVVDKIGAATEYGKIGTAITENQENKTPLQRQTGKLVLACAILAGVLFLLVAVFTFISLDSYELGDRIVSSILSGITLSMAMIPEEIPVILAVFLSMGAWRLAKSNSLVRNLHSVETLGAISVLCVDKTGTITQNKMTVTSVYAVDNNTDHLVEVMGLACETETYDPMEKAMLAYCESYGISKQHIFSGNLLSEYSFDNQLKMMGHVWDHDGIQIIACKGSCESVLALCNLSSKQQELRQQQIDSMSREGLRVIAVASAQIEGEVPEKLSDCNLTLCGFIGLSDPPRDNIKADIETCIRAGIRVVMITGDNGITASSIAKKIGIKDYNNVITGAQLEQMTDEKLRQEVKTVSIFSRVIPQHKMRIVKAFKDNGEVVAMTGDGVNDAPALKYADIGIAMGKRGSEVSREAADLILLDDNFSTIINTIKDGRRIYDNIRKAVGYVFAIHIPIALAALVAPILGIAPSALMLMPIHVVILELIIDPTCSIVLERQPSQSGIMTRKPRSPDEKLLSKKTFLMSFVQGLIICFFAFGSYLYIYFTTSNANLARTMAIVIIVLSNILLVIVSNSGHDFAYYAVKKLLKDKVIWIINLVVIALIAIAVYSPLNGYLKLEALNIAQLGIAIGFAFASVAWREIIKVFNRKKIKNN